MDEAAAPVPAIRAALLEAYEKKWSQIACRWLCNQIFSGAWGSFGLSHFVVDKCRAWWLFMVPGQMSRIIMHKWVCPYCLLCSCMFACYIPCILSCGSDLCVVSRN